ncbi:MAG TPA: hypothetical protein PLJ47_06725, partial [Candidatus Hydrogenedentes bacterium]|nr:hypothetical protein [Candidatus Hydrogenedentota bacterium]
MNGGNEQEIEPVVGGQAIEVLVSTFDVRAYTDPLVNSHPVNGLDMPLANTLDGTAPAWGPSGSTGGIMRLYSGDFTEHAVDLAVPGLGLDTVFARRYLSRGGLNSDIGNKWESSFNLRVFRKQAPAPSTLAALVGSNRIVAFTKAVGQTVDGGPGLENRLLYNAEAGWPCVLGLDTGNSESFIRWDDGTIWLLEGIITAYQPVLLENSRVSEIRDRNGNAIHIEFDTIQRVAQVTDTLNRVYDFQYYPGNSGKLKSISEAGGLQRQVEYVYYSETFDDIDNDSVPDGTPGDLARVTYLPGTDLERSVTYTYSVNSEPELSGLLTRIIDAKNRIVVENEYDADGRVIRQSFEDPTITRTYSYDDFDAGEVPPIDIGPASTTTIEPRHQTFVKNEHGFITEYLFDASNRVVRERQYLGIASPEETIGATTLDLLVPGVRGGNPQDFYETRYAWNNQFNLTEMCDSGGTHTIFGYETDIDSQPLKRGHITTTDVYNLAGSGPIHTANRYLPSHSSGLHLLEFVDVSDFDQQGTFTLTTHYQYDSKANVTTITYPAPALTSESFTYHANGLVDTHTSPNTVNESGAEAFPRTDKFTHTFNADGSYEVKAVQDSSGEKVTTINRFDAAGRLAASIDPKGNAYSYTFTPYDQLEFTAAPSPAPGIPSPNTTYTYDENNNVLSISEANIDDNGTVNSPIITEYVYDVMDRVSRIVHDKSLLAATTAYDYLAGGRNFLVSTPEATSGSQPGNDMLYEYDERGLLFRSTRSGAEVTTYNYDNWGNVAEQLFPDNTSVTNQYDNYGRLSKTIDRIGTFRSVVLRNNRGQILEETVHGTANNLLSTTRTAYDERGRISNVRLNSDTNGTSFFYTPAGQLWKTVDPEGRTITTGYDSMHLPRVTTDEQGNTATYEYDPNSNVTQIVTHEENEAGANQTTTSESAYDNLNRQISTTDMADHETLMRYDSLNRVRETVDGNGNIRRYAYDNLNRQIGTQHYAPNGQTLLASTAQSFDLNGRLISQTDPKQFTTSYRYDALDRRNQVTYADGSSITVLQFDAMRRPLQIRNQDGTLVTNTFDDEGRVKTRTTTAPTGVLSTSESFDYDGLGRVTQTTASGADAITTSTTITYNDLANPPSVIKQANFGAISRTLKTSYLHTGQPAEVELPGGRTLDYSYNNAGRMNGILEGTTPIATIDYVGGRRVRQTLGGEVRANFAYNPSEDGYRVSGTTHTDLSPSTTTLDARTNEWDANYNRLERNITTGAPAEQGVHTYSYDALNRMESSPDETYTLDAAGNRTNIGYEFSGTGSRLHQYSDSPKGALGYDAAGRLNALLDSDNSYVYDAMGRLKELRLGAGAGFVDFTALPNGTEIDSGDWEISNGYLEETSTGAGRIRWPMNASMQRFAFRYWSGHDPQDPDGNSNQAFDHFDPEYYAQVIVRATEHATTGEWTFLALVIQPDGIYLREWNDDAVTELGGVAVAIPKEQWHDVTIQLSGERISVRQVLAGSSQAQSIESETSIFTGAYVGFGVGEKAIFRFDDVGTDAPVSASVALRYHYDAYGRVIGRTLAPGTQNEDTQYFLYDNDRIIQELDGTGALVAEWVYGTYIDEIYAMYRDTDGDGSLDATYYYLQDDLYNV